MLPPIEEIEKRRRNLGLTQKQLAKVVNVSQSMIAKIEGGRMNPSYLKTKAIFDTLENLERRKEVKAREISQSKVVGVERFESVARASRLMKKTGFSQLPVFDGQQVVGSLSEKTILNQILVGRDLARLSKMCVEEIMEETFPCVDEETPLTAISTLLQYASAVLTTRIGRITGIITKADLLKVVRA